MAASASGIPRARFREHSLPVRILSGVVLSLITLGCVWKGGWYFSSLAIVGLLVGLWEFLRMGARGGYPVIMGAGLAAGATLLVLSLTHGAANVGVVLLALGVWMIGASLRPPVEKRLVGLALTVLGVLYVVGLGLHILWLREMERGLVLMVVVLLGTWAADTFAFFVGVRFGKTRLLPEVSPSKSVEGLWGGIAGALITVVTAMHFLVPETSLTARVLAGLMIGVMSPLGDLLESMFKRNLGIKDASHVIPGHGGVLDRIDSLLLTAPAAYYVFRFLLS